MSVGVGWGPQLAAPFHLTRPGTAIPLHLYLGLVDTVGSVQGATVKLEPLGLGMRFQKSLEFHKIFLLIIFSLYFQTKRWSSPFEGLLSTGPTPSSFCGQQSLSKVNTILQ